MKVILLQDLPNLGKKFEVKEVKGGFARNFLLPKKLALPFNPKTKKWLKKMLKEKERKEAEKLKLIEELKRIEVEIKVGPKGEVFEKVTKNKILNLLRQRGVQIQKENILLKKPIDSLGVHKIQIHLGGKIFEIEVEVKPKSK